MKKVQQQRRRRTNKQFSAFSKRSIQGMV